MWYSTIWHKFAYITWFYLLLKRHCHLCCTAHIMLIILLSILGNTFESGTAKAIRVKQRSLRHCHAQIPIIWHLPSHRHPRMPKACMYLTFSEPRLQKDVLNHLCSVNNFTPSIHLPRTSCEGRSPYNLFVTNPRGWAQLIPVVLACGPQLQRSCNTWYQRLPTACPHTDQGASSPQQVAGQTQSC
jgi:hypothetical protein